jgi:hypothetical protein
MFEIRTICSDIMTNYRLSQKFKLIKNNKFNHLIDIVTMTTA